MMSVRVDVQPVLKYLSDIEKKHLPFAEAKALTAVASLARGEVIREMARTFDRPMPQTVNEQNGPLWLKTADYKKLRSGVGDFSEVRVKDQSRGKTGQGGSSDPAIAWLSHNIYGGRRIEKRLEYILRRVGKIPTGVYLVPGEGMPLDQYGNVARGEINRVLADLKGRVVDGYNNESTPRSRARRRASRSKRPSFYFSTWPPHPRTKHLTPGIYLRTETAWGGLIKPAFIFAKGLPRYPRRIRFQEICYQVGVMRFPAAFRFQLKQALANPRPGHGS